MAMNWTQSGDRTNAELHNRPWTAVAGYTSPARGDLVKQDTSGNRLVNICSAGDVPLGLVVQVGGDGVLTVREFLPGETVVLEYTGTFAIGDKVVSNATSGTIAIGGFTRQQVKHDNTNGTGTVVAKDAPATGLCEVRY
jgi:hypothetical protein